MSTPPGPARILVVNCGSSSVKVLLHDPAAGLPVGRGSVTRMGRDADLWLEGPGGARRERRRLTVHDEALGALLDGLLDPAVGGIAALADVAAVGHRVVHGGDRYDRSTLVTDEVVAALEERLPLAPLHTPPSLAGIREARRRLPQVPHVAVFDTTFHRTIPPRAHRYALPRRFHDEHGIRRYGFHGTSFRYVSGRAASLLGRPASELRMVLCHLGHGCSIAAAAEGQAVDTSMGMTPLEGLVMGTRSGDLDPGVVLFLQRHLGLSVDAVERVLNEESGLLGLTDSGDMREVSERAERGDEDCRLALDLFAYRVRKYVGAYAAAMGGIDALVFTAGIGENSPLVRRMICSGLSFIGVDLDEARNAATIGTEDEIGRPGARARVLVIPTDEERVIVEDTLALTGIARTGP